LRGKKNRESGQRFERKVRADLESKGWIVDRWTNNVELNNSEEVGKLIPAKSRFGLRTTGFPDFIAYRHIHQHSKSLQLASLIYGVECKSGGYLNKEEKAKCRWLATNVFSKIFIASKGKKRGEIIYEEFK